MTDKPLYQIGEYVYSHLNRTHKGKITRIRDKTKQCYKYNAEHYYYVNLTPSNRKWISEHLLSKTLLEVW